ncbi:MAG TPA: SMC family ATPase, partial [Actinotalea sp.]
GKSTLIDALVFALYGKVASQDASEDRLRSAYAGPDQETVVDLVFESGSGIYRVRRTPRYERAKQRGTGTTTRQPSVQLWRLTTPDAPDGDLMSSRLDEAGAELQRIIGLDRSQFVQTVVLPQGEFASFLRANPEDRRGLLQKVFGTVVYEQLQQRLERMRADVTRSLDDRRRAVSQSAARFAGAAGLPPEDAEQLTALAGAVADDGAAVLQVTTGHIDRLAAEALVAESLAVVAGQERATAQLALDQARTLVAADARRAALRTELADLDLRAEEHAHALVRRDGARRAQAVYPCVVGAEAADRAVTDAQRQVDRATTAAPLDVRALVDAFADADVQRKTLTEERETCTALVATLRRLVELEAELPARHGRQRAGAAARAAKQRERDRLVVTRGDRPAERVVLAARLADAARVAGGLTAAEQMATVAQTRLDAAGDVQRLTAEVDRAETTVATFAARAQAAVATAAELQRLRIVGIAGELAAGLRPGEPCVVCGGVEHPAPAPVDPHRVTVEDVEAAELAREDASSALTAAADELSVLRQRLEGRRVATGGLDVQAAGEALASAREAVGAAMAAGHLEHLLSTELDRFDRVTEQMDAQVTALGVELAAEAAQLSSELAQLERDEQEISGSLAGARSVQERVASLTGRAAAIGVWVDALRGLEECQAQRSVRAAELAASLAEHDFDGPGAVLAARLDRLALSSLEQAIAAYEAARSRVAAGLAEQELAGLPEVVDVDVAGARSAHDLADARATAAAGDAARHRLQADAAGAAGVELGVALRVLTDLVVEAAPVVRMANLAGAASADNAEQLTLATYVLSRRFDDVVAAANARLVAMSDGRYELARSSEREDVRARRRGLAMQVLDHRTESARDPRTLSGGETFYVSLCLALGLADVVTAEAGGIDLGTLFVDEGFGSLDSDTLDVVLTELARLRDGGRVVGVVSHVEALKQSIPERIEVRRCADGSSTLSVRA